MNNDETFSTAEATKMIGEMVGVVRESMSKFHSAHDDFINTLSQNWEDKNLTDMVKKYAKNLAGFSDELNANLSVFATLVSNIADDYAKLGGLSGAGVSTDVPKLDTTFDVSKIKDKFPDGRVGLLKTSSGILLQSVDAYKHALQSLKSSTAAKIRSVIAFGNPAVQRALGSAAEAIIKIFSNHIDQSVKDVGNYFETGINQYVKMGNFATDAANKTASSAS